MTKIISRKQGVDNKQEDKERGIRRLLILLAFVVLLLAVMIVYSGNDAAYNAAAYVAGSEEAFVERMNQKAAQIGMNHTHFVNSHGMDVDGIIRANKRNECEATQKEVEMLARCVDDERISRTDIPKILGESYRKSESDGVFDKIKRLRHVGIYSKVSTLLFAAKQKKEK